MATPTNVPGSYPLDDSVPPTPQPQPQPQPEQTSAPLPAVQFLQHLPHHGHHDHHEHHERNKLHKANDPHGHRPRDSGIVMNEPEAASSLQPTSAQALEPITDNDHMAQRTASHEPKIDRIERSGETPPQRGVGDQPQAQREGDLGPAVLGASGATTTASPNQLDNEHDANIAEGKAGDASAPYWGNLPKAASGGIYNTVTGHGSAGDDHAQHHNLPPSGGVYNTVTGHGSPEQASHHSPTIDASPTSSDASRRSGPAGGGALTATLPRIPEEKKASSSTAPTAERAEILPGFLPEVATTDLGLASSAVARPVDSKLSPPKSPSRAKNKPTDSSQPILPGFLPETATNDLNLSSSASSSSKPRGQEAASSSSVSPKSQRAFPLASSPHRHPEEDSSDNKVRNGAIVGAAGIGAGIGASQFTDNRRGRQDEDTREIRESSANRDHKSPRRVLSRNNRHEKEPSQERKARRDSSHGSEKKHKFLGIFHRHKGEEEKEDTSTQEPRRKSTGDHPDHQREQPAPKVDVAPSGPNVLRKGRADDQTRDRRSSAPSEDKTTGGNKGKIAAGAAAGGGLLGILHQKDDKGENYREPAPAAEKQVHGSSETPSAAHIEREPGQPRAVAFAGLTPDASSLHQDPSTPFEHPRDAPPPPVAPSTSHSDARSSHGEPSYSVLASGTTSGIHPTASHKERDTASHGIATVEPGKYDTLASGTASGVTRSQQRSTNESEVQHGPENYGVLLSSGSPVHHSHSAKREATTAVNRIDSGKADKAGYSTLASGTPSGISRDTKTSIRQTQGGSIQRQDSGPYNVLPSGTPSGVKIKPHEISAAKSTPNQTTGTGAHNHHGQYQTLASGTASGVDTTRHHESTGPSSESGMEKNKRVSNQHVSAAAFAPSPSHKKEAESEPKSESQQQRLTTFPDPERVKHMSPEVMPEAYTASAPRHSEAEIKAVSQQQSRGAENKSDATNPALAAATASWAASSAAGAGAGASGKVLHRCQHCGRENDISEYFGKEGQGVDSATVGKGNGLWAPA